MTFTRDNIRSLFILVSGNIIAIFLILLAFRLMDFINAPMLLLFALLSIFSVASYLNFKYVSRISYNNRSYKNILDVLRIKFINKTLKVLITADDHLFKAYKFGTIINFTSFLLKIHSEILEESIFQVIDLLGPCKVPKNGILRFVGASEQSISITDQVFSVRFSKDYQENLKNVHLFVLWLFFRDKPLEELEMIFKKFYRED